MNITIIFNANMKMRNIIHRITQKLGYQIVKIIPPDIRKQYPDIGDTNFWTFWEACSPFTMTTVDRMFALYQSVNYIIDNDIEGDFVECGVWRGGSSMMIAQILKTRNIKNRSIYLYDTFEGMPAPSSDDVDFSGNDAKKLLMDVIEYKENAPIWCYATEADVIANISSTEIDLAQVHLIKGKVEDTIPTMSPKSNIALLRLDTDWYASTKHELIHLYPTLSAKGVLIIDDYGHWQGCRKAVDEYFSESTNRKLLHRIDYTGRILIKD
jgi:hypothetical protein